MALDQTWLLRGLIPILTTIGLLLLTGRWYSSHLESPMEPVDYLYLFLLAISVLVCVGLTTLIAVSFMAG